MIAQGEIWWADLPEPVGSEPGYRRPVVVIQGESFNRSKIATVICAAFTTNLSRAEFPAHVLLSARDTGLRKDSVVNMSHVVTLDRQALTDRIGKISRSDVEVLLRALDIVLGR